MKLGALIEDKPSTITSLYVYTHVEKLEWFRSSIRKLDFACSVGKNGIKK